LCPLCKEIKGLESIRLDCGCILKEFGKKVQYKFTSIEIDCGKYARYVPLTPIDLGLINDLESFELTSLMLFDCYTEKKRDDKIIRMYNILLRRKRMELWLDTIEYNNVNTQLYLGSSHLIAELLARLSEKLKRNDIIELIDFGGNAARESMHQ
jgi:hypothetical protein